LSIVSDENEFELLGKILFLGQGQSSQRGMVEAAGFAPRVAGEVGSGRGRSERF